MKECLYCKKEFEPKKPKQLFCSDKHRTYFHRAKKRAILQADKIAKSLKEVELIEQSERATKLWDELIKELDIKSVKAIKAATETKCPERMEGESGIDYQLRLAEWRDKRK